MDCAPGADSAAVFRNSSLLHQKMGFFARDSLNLLPKKRGFVPHSPKLCIPVIDIRKVNMSPRLQTQFPSFVVEYPNMNMNKSGSPIKSNFQTHLDSFSQFKLIHRTSKEESNGLLSYYFSLQIFAYASTQEMSTHFSVLKMSILRGILN
jgi:hypothetical protein